MRQSQRPPRLDPYSLLVARETARHIPSDPDTLSASGRKRSQVDAFYRQVVMYLCHTLLGKPYSTLAHEFGCDRTTVTYSCYKVEDLRDAKRLHFIDRLEAEITAQL